LFDCPDEIRDILIMKHVIFVFLTGIACAAEWKAGVASVAITPTEPIWMVGFGSRVKPHQEVRAEIFAKAFALEDTTGKYGWDNTWVAGLLQ